MKELYSSMEKPKKCTPCNTAEKHVLRKVFLVMMLVAVVFTSCVNSYKSHIADYTTSNTNAAPDYSNLYYWAAHPYKWDPSDSLPKPYRKEKTDTTVDVFFVHPTTFTDVSKIISQPNGGNLWIADINDDTLNAKTDYSTILKQASPFNHYRLFAPRYRQAHYQSYFTDAAIAKPFFETAYQDVKTAFIYYMAHYNNGRAFIIASHSQGTEHAQRLIKELVENKSVAKKMIAAYLIGMPIRDDYFTTVPVCKDTTETGCFVSWRSYKNGYIPPKVAAESFTAVVVNPLTWRTDETFASRSLNKGAVLLNFNKVKKKNASAVVHGNILWTSRPRFPGSIFYTDKNYHIADINMFWKNIRDNVRARVDAFKEK